MSQIIMFCTDKHLINNPREFYSSNSLLIENLNNQSFQKSVGRIKYLQYTQQIQFILHEIIKLTMK